MQRPRERSSTFVTLSLAFALAAIAGCAGSAPPGTTGGGTPDMAMCTTFACKGGCDTTADCKDGKMCDPGSHACVQCLADKDCPSGNVCGLSTHTCAAGCNAMHDCASDGGLCEADAGMCVECLGDPDCKDPMLPRCDPAAHKCAPCLPAGDNCGHALFCAPQQMTFSCAPGCKDDTDCMDLPVDAGAGPHDGGGAGDGGPSDGGPSDGGLSYDGDGGVKGNANAHCDTKLHQCVRCLADTDCPAGRICKADQCVAGCTDQHGCEGKLSCCGAPGSQTCVDTTSDFQNCGMCGTQCQGGWNCCNSACSNPLIDNVNCGTCGNTCMTPNATASCTQRTCTVAKCNMGYADCNGVYMDGCETHTDVNVNNCGSCNNACAIPHATPKCVGGGCQIDTCVFPFQDCNNMVNDGCETNTQSSDVMNCGGCNTVCNLAHASPLCDKGVCKVSQCQNGFADCNGNPADGCEVDLNSTVASCGGCNMACTVANASPSCSMGKCTIASCNANFADCDTDPKTGCEISIATDPLHCGSCAKVCSTVNGTASCAAGACKIACATGFGDCNMSAADGCEINLNTNVNNCGTCAKVCALANATPTCNGGNCQVMACNSGFADCDLAPANGCEINLTNDATHCGSCGTFCSTANGTASCAAGKCQIVCKAGFGDCNGDVTDGCETNLNTSATSCGACGKACMAANGVPACMGGGCVVAACNTGFADCDKNPVNGCEIQTTNDVANCGGCANACSANNGTPSCLNSACQIACKPNFANCNNNAADGCEVALQTDVKNCGACNNACNLPNATPQCTAGACAIMKCNLGFADCNGIAADGCEVNLNTDTGHCGTCATVCSNNNGTPSCTNGSCSIACGAGFGNCDGIITNGCETNINNNTGNCGSCGNVCNGTNGTASCGGGTCAIACNAGFGNCDGNVANGCEINLTNNANSCGTCGTVCNGTNGTPSCVNSMCQIACAAGFGNCDGVLSNGCETNLNTTLSSCGGCGASCPGTNQATNACTNGACTGSCNAGFANCNNNLRLDGCEVNLNADPANCGGCAAACPGTNQATNTCSAGQCTGTCNGGFANCDNNFRSNGCEVNLNNDVNNCGGCSQACSGNHIAASCGGGSCEGGACAANFFDVNANKRADGCECGAVANNCGSRDIIGDVAFGAAPVVSGSIAGQQSEHWYDVDWLAGAGGAPPQYHPHVLVTTTAGSAVVFDVYTYDCNLTGNYGCATEGGVSLGRTDWETNMTAGDSNTDGAAGSPFAWTSPPPSTHVLVRVRGTDPKSCSTYTITFKNG